MREWSKDARHPRLGRERRAAGADNSEQRARCGVVRGRASDATTASATEAWTTTLRCPDNDDAISGRAAAATVAGWGGLRVGKKSGVAAHTRL